MVFKLKYECSKTGARIGKLNTRHGEIETPVFMPVGTQGTVKTMAPHELEELNSQIILGNTYHLYLRPGHKIIEKAGGLHSFINWHRPILTDSGGFQVFSLGNLRKIDNDGVLFKSHLDGSSHFITPEKSIEIQNSLGADIIMNFDECSPYPASIEEAEEAVNRTTKWAIRCKESHKRIDEQLLFGIIQGSMYNSLREKSAKDIIDIDFDAYAIGGLSVGEPKDIMYEVLDYTVPFLPSNKARYLMGVGSPDCLIEGIVRGIDMFDCVMPTRMARNGCILTNEGRVTIKNAKYKDDFSKIDNICNCYVCNNFTKAYLRHLFKANEILGLRLATYHNLFFILNMVREIKIAIKNNKLLEYKNKILSHY